MRELFPPAIVSTAENDLTRLATQIVADHEAGEAATRRGLAHYRAAGQNLNKAKSRLGDRRWPKWLQASVRLDEETARRYMQLADSTATAELLPDVWHRISGPGESAPPRDGGGTDQPSPSEARAARRIAGLHSRAAGPSVTERWQIVHGDCLAELASLKEPARLIFADPQCNAGVDYGDGPEGDQLPPELYARHVVEWVAACRDALTADGSLWILIDHAHAYEVEAAIRAAKLTVRAWVTWYETFGNCNSAGTNFSRTSRRLFYCVKDPDRFVWNSNAVRVPSDRQKRYKDPRANPDGKMMDDVWLDIPRLAGTHAERLPEFPTQLPVALPYRVVACTSEPGDLVVDPFSGSATTGVAALRLGRRYLGIERRAPFVQLSRLRLRGEQSPAGSEMA